MNEFTENNRKQFISSTGGQTVPPSSITITAMSRIVNCFKTIQVMLFNFPDSVTYISLELIF